MGLPTPQTPCGGNDTGCVGLALKLCLLGREGVHSVDISPMRPCVAPRGLCKIDHHHRLLNNSFAGLSSAGRIVILFILLAESPFAWGVWHVLHGSDGTPSWFDYPVPSYPGFVSLHFLDSCCLSKQYCCRERPPPCSMVGAVALLDWACPHLRPHVVAMTRAVWGWL